MRKVNEEELNGIQTAAFLGFCRQFLTYYVDCLRLSSEEYERLEGLNNCVNEIDKLLSENTSLCKNLRVFCLKLIRSKEKSLRAMQMKYISINRAHWMKGFRDEFKDEATSKQFIIPPKVSEASAIDPLLKQFEDSGFREVPLLGEMLKIDDATSRYKLFTMFMTEIYSGVCGPQATNIVKGFIETLKPTATLAK